MYHNKGQNRNEQAAEDGNQPQRDAGEEAHLTDGGFYFLWEGHSGAGKGAEISRHGRDNPCADGKKRGHNLHAVGHGGFRRNKADKVAQRLLRPTKVTEVRRTFENADGKEQNNKSVAD